MTTLLLANIGNRDVQLTDLSRLPQAAQAQRWDARQRGEAILADYAHYAPALRFPLLDVTLRWLLEHEGVAPETLHVHLFASDQPANTPASERNKDTAPYAQVIRRWLLEDGLAWTAVVESEGQPRPEPRRLRLPGRQVHLHTIAGNPADYGNLLDFFGRELPRLADRIAPADRVYLEVSGGTPAMTSMLIVAGVDAFGPRADVLYVEPDADRPYRLSVGAQLLSRHVRRTVQAQLDLHAYAAAGATLAAHPDLLIARRDHQALAAALVRYADRRLAFDFDRAREALSQALPGTLGSVQAQVQNWWRELQTRDLSLFLAELIHSATILYRLGEYACFTQRLFRFQEASFRALVEQMGLRYRAPDDDEYVDLRWVDEVPGLRDFLADYQAPGGKRYQPVRLDIPLNRVNLGAIVDFFTQRDPAWTRLRPTAQALHRLSAVEALRNKGLAGHGFQGIGAEDLDRAFGGDAAAIIPLLHEIYQGLFQRPVGDDPYQAVNHLIHDLLAA